MEKIAIRTNDESICELVIKKLENEGHIKPNSMIVNQLIYMCYIPDKDIIVSPLCLEMWHPEYKEITGEEFLTTPNK